MDDEDKQRRYVVITKRSAAAFRSAFPEIGPDRRDERNVLMGLLGSARLVDAKAGRRGAPLERYRWRSRDGRTGSMELCLGVDDWGQPEVAPDGVKRIAYLTYFGVDGPC